jgi:hypothetical protein
MLVEITVVARAPRECESPAHGFRDPTRLPQTDCPLQALSYRRKKCSPRDALTAQTAPQRHRRPALREEPCEEHRPRALGDEAVPVGGGDSGKAVAQPRSEGAETLVRLLLRERRNRRYGRCDGCAPAL